MKRLASFIILMVLVASTYAHAQETPRITAIMPSFGPTSGGTEVTISGSGFLLCQVTCVPILHLTIGGISVPFEVTDTTVRFTTPPHPPGEVEVMFRPLMGEDLRTTFLYTDAEAVPTLSKWGLLLMAVTLAVVALKRLT